MKEVVITAGGTRESIDDVRFVGNFSAGSFGVAIASAVAREATETDVTLLAPKETMERFEINPDVRREIFTDAASLGKLLLEREATPDVFIHAAAVADYTPERRYGKISSDANELTITMRRTPKLLSQLRTTYGARPFLTGFKLLSNVPQTELVRVGLQQLKNNGLDLTIANDLQDIRPLGRKVIAINPDASIHPMEGSTKTVAEELALYILEQAARKESDRIAAIIPESI